MRHYERYRETGNELELIFELQQKKRAIISALIGICLLACSYIAYTQPRHHPDPLYIILLGFGLLWLLISLAFNFAKWQLVIAHDTIYIATRQNKRQRSWRRHEIKKILLFRKPPNRKGKRGFYPWRVDFVTTKTERSRSGLKFDTEESARQMTIRLASAMELPIKEKCH